MVFSFSRNVFFTFVDTPMPVCPQSKLNHSVYEIPNIAICLWIFFSARSLKKKNIVGGVNFGGIWLTI